MNRKDDCPIITPPELKMGAFVNAFRILPDIGEELLLDFCVYSQQEHEATVVARLRVHQDFIPQLQTYLGELLLELTPEVEGVLH